MSCVSRSFDIAQNSSEVIKSWNSATTGIQAVNSLGGASEFKALTQSALDSIKSAQLGMKALNDWGGVSGILATAKRANESRRYLAAATAGIQAMNSLGGASEIPVLTQSALGSIKSAQVGFVHVKLFGYFSKGNSWRSKVLFSISIDFLNYIIGIAHFNRDYLMNFPYAFCGWFSDVLENIIINSKFIRNALFQQNY